MSGGFTVANIASLSNLLIALMLSTERRMVSSQLLSDQRIFIAFSNTIGLLT